MAKQASTCCPCHHSIQALRLARWIAIDSAARALTRHMRAHADVPGTRLVACTRGDRPLHCRALREIAKCYSTCTVVVLALRLVPQVPGRTSVPHVPRLNRINRLRSCKSYSDTVLFSLFIAVPNILNLVPSCQMYVVQAYSKSFSFLHMFEFYILRTIL
eukprot:COSAG02_NODE_6846_length_3329_cov_6.995356_1_plen_160_part_00